MTTRIQMRRGTATDWAEANPVLADGEPGWATDALVLKIGNGTLGWNGLPPISDSELLALVQAALTSAEAAAAAAAQSAIDAEAAGGGGGGSGTITSVNGDSGPAIVLDMDDLAETATWKKLTAAERTKLTGVATGATANDSDANLKNRANHTGSGPISSVTGLQAALDSKLTTVSIAALPSGSTVRAKWTGAAWPARPTARTDILVIWTGGTDALAPAGGITDDLWAQDAS